MNQEEFDRLHEDFHAWLRRVPISSKVAFWMLILSLVLCGIGAGYTQYPDTENPSGPTIVMPEYFLAAGIVAILAVAIFCFVPVRRRRKKIGSETITFTRLPVGPSESVTLLPVVTSEVPRD